MSLDTSGFVQTVNANITSGSSVNLGSGSLTQFIADDVLVATHPLGEQLYEGAGSTLLYQNRPLGMTKYIAKGRVSPTVDNTWVPMTCGGVALSWDEGAASGTSSVVLQTDSINDRAGGTGATDVNLRYITSSADGFFTLGTGGQRDLNNGAGPYTGDAHSNVLRWRDVEVVRTGTYASGNDGTISVLQDGVVVATMEPGENYITSGMHYFPLVNNIGKIREVGFGFNSGPDPIADVSARFMFRADYTDPTRPPRELLRINMLGSGTVLTDLKLPLIQNLGECWWEIRPEDASAVSEVTGYMVVEEYF